MPVKRTPGVCQCGRPAKPGRWRCSSCTDSTARWMQNRYWIRVANGLCTECGKIKVDKFRKCRDCRLKATK